MFSIYRSYTVKKENIIIAGIIATVFFAGACARVGSPPGGPKDTTPPKVLASTPENHSVNFTGNTIEICFNEFVELDNIQKKLIVSPPLTERPEIRMKGKTLIIKLNNVLLDSTTYTFQFGDAIKDLNEGNILENYSFVFSTGPTLDSLQIRGQLEDAFTLRPPEEAFVLLYDHLGDSIPFLEKPLYMSKADQDGKFYLQNLKADTFRIVALVDGNLNYKYDQGQDMVGFLDSLIFLKPLPAYSHLNDSTTIDSLRMLSGPDFLLRLFLENMEQQYLKNSDRPRKEMIVLIFNLPALHPEITPLVPDIPVSWYIPEESVTGDTLELWLTDTSLIRLERFDLAVSYAATDSLGNPTQITDTVTLRIKTPKKGKKSAKKTEKSQSLLQIASNASRGSKELNSPLLLEPSAPVRETDTSRIVFYRLKDTLFVRQPYLFLKDSFFLRRYMIQCSWKENTKYKLELLPGALTDIYGNTTDTLVISFHTRRLAEYGNFKLNLQNIPGQTLVQLWDASEKNRIRQYIIVSDTSVYFNYLNPGKYIVKAVDDKNHNKAWDTGVFLENIQPEPVAYFSKEINIKANWDVEETWKVVYDFAPRIMKRKRKR